MSDEQAPANQPEWLVRIDMNYPYVVLEIRPAANPDADPIRLKFSYNGAKAFASAYLEQMTALSRFTAQLSSCDIIA